MPPLFHLLHFHDADGTEMECHFTIKAVNQFGSPSHVLHTQQLEYSIIQFTTVRALQLER